MPDLMETQREAIAQLGCGKVLYGAVGTGKTRAALAYYVDHEEYRDIYVITTPRKRDSNDWEDEAILFGIGPDASTYGRLHVDSWNNIDKYRHVEGAFFIFDEQRVVGKGAWVQAFLKITQNNRWILLTGTPGDNWMDYLPLFLANGFYKTKTEFYRRHVKYKHTPWLAYPVIDYFLDESHLEALRNEILVEMRSPFEDKRVLNWWPVGHDKERFRMIHKKRWNVFESCPVLDVAEMFRLMRRLVNSDPSRLEELRVLHGMHPRLIVFYSFDYELEILRTLYQETNVFEWNGHRKNPLESFEGLDRWVYLVQYVSGAEAWNCVSTDAMVFWSLTYSYKNFEQAQGRIDRMNTPFERLYYYMFVSDSWIDSQIRKSLERKESFNEKKAIRESKIEVEMASEMESDLDAKYGEILEICEI